MSGMRTHGITRRQALGSAVSVFLTQALHAQHKFGPPPHEHGPKIFLDYDQVELDAMYDQTVYAPNWEQVLGRQAANSQRVRARLGAPGRAAYGGSAIERLDVYKAHLGKRKAPNTPVHIFIHGGAWRVGSAEQHAALAQPFVEAGAHVVIPDFSAVQDAAGSLLVMASQVRRAITWVYKNAFTFGGDRNRIYLSGHSSGAHLASCALTTDWQNDFGLPSDLIKGALLISGIYDLKAPRLSSRREYVKFDDQTEEALSPQRHIDRFHTPLIVAYTRLDTPEFQRQSREFAAALQAAGKQVEVIVGERRNHFEFLDELESHGGKLARLALAQMKLRS